MIPWFVRSGTGVLKSNRWKLYGYRTISGTTGMCFFFYALAVMPLMDVVALTFTVPLVTTLFAAIFLKEKTDKHLWLAMIAGFFGVLIILRPGMDSFQYASLCVLATACCWGASNIFVKKLTRSEDPMKIVFIMVLIMTPVSLPLALFVWQTPTLEQLTWLAVLGYISNQAQFAMTHAYSHADLKTVQPFDFSRLIFISIIAYIFFDEHFDIWTMAGSLVIFLSSMYIIRKASKQRKSMMI